jgi:hypothetical protein
VRKPRRRGVSEKSDTPFSPYAEGWNRAALRAYRICIFGLIPGMGLLLGPAAVLLGALAWRSGRSDPAFTAQSPARAAMVLGALIGLTNAAGVTLMILGWRG